jgi:hypothetical protein
MKTLLLAAAFAASPALAESPLRSERAEASIPFVSHPRAIRSFEAVEDHLLYLQDRRGRWYLAELAGPCFGLRWANRIGYDTKGGMSLDRFSTILVDGERCRILSLTHSSPPPRKARKAKKG